MTIRTATAADLAAIAAVEAACFPAAEAATEAEFAARLAVYPNHFWLLEEDGKLISFIDGLVTDEPILRDEMYENAAFHNENGAWQMIFGVNTLPAWRKQGCAGKLMERAISDARAQGRPDLQGGLGSLLRNVRLRQRGPLRLHPRRRGVVRHAADLLRRPEGRVWNGYHQKPGQRRRGSGHSGGSRPCLLEGAEAGGPPPAAKGRREKAVRIPPNCQKSVRPDGRTLFCVWKGLPLTRPWGRRSEGRS